MEKTARKNIMEIYEGWGIFRKILKHDLTLDRTSGRWRMVLSGQRVQNYPALELSKLSSWRRSRLSSLRRGRRSERVVWVMSSLCYWSVTWIARLAACLMARIVHLIGQTGTRSHRWTDVIRAWWSQSTCGGEVLEHVQPRWGHSPRSSLHAWDTWGCQHLWWKHCSTSRYRRPPFLIAGCRDPQKWSCVSGQKSRATTRCD